MTMVASSGVGRISPPPRQLQLFVVGGAACFPFPWAFNFLYEFASLGR